MSTEYHCVASLPTVESFIFTHTRATLSSDANGVVCDQNYLWPIIVVATVPELIKRVILKADV